MRRWRAGHPSPAILRIDPRGLLLALTLLAAACRPGGHDGLPYGERIARQRADKDEFFATNRQSPVPADKRAEFLPLAYFPIDPAYAVPAALGTSDREPAVEMPTSTGLRRRMRRAGTLQFALKGQPLQLTAFVEEGDTALNRLFVPFADLTNGTETYPAGRYLDLTRTATGIYEIDFNLAYYPYCFYNPTYDCPYPPPENRLKIAVRSGERTKFDEDRP
jgi:uncharacterized protein (DUF1684 family)